MQEKTGIKVEVEAKKYNAFVNVDGKSTQATRSGKNLIPYPYKDTSLTMNGITFTDNGDGTVTINGTATALAYFRLSNSIDYGLSISGLGTGTNGTYAIPVTSNKEPFMNYNANNKILSINVNAGITIDNYTFKPILIKGTSVTQDDYEPYGASPSPEFPSEIKSVGDDVNLFDGELELGNINSSGNADNTAMIRSINYNTINPAEEFIVSSPDYDITNSDIQVFFYDENKTYISDVWKINFTTPDNAKYYRFKLLNNTNITTKVKIQKGTVATPYSEYGKGTVTIEQRGKNLWDEKYLNGYYSSTGDFVSANNQICTENYIKVAPNETYWLGVYSYVLAICLYDKNQKFISRIGFTLPTKNGITYTTDDKTYYIKINFSDNYGYTYKNDIMIAKGSMAIDYEPYFSKDYVLPVSEPLRSLPNGTKDTIEADGIHRRVGSVVLDGSADEGWTFYAAAKANGYVYWVSSITDCVKSWKNSICSHFRNLERAWDYGTIGDYADHPTLTNKYFVTDKPTVAEWKAWLQQNPITLQYELAEEVVEPFTDEQLEVLDSIETQKGTNIFSIDSELEPAITVIYKGKDENWDSTDIISLKYFNELIINIQTYADKLGIKYNLIEKSNGEFVFSEELDEIDRVLEVISNTLLLNYERKYWYNLSTINYNDWNKWDNQINLIEDKLKNIKVFTYNDEATDGQDTYIKLLYEEV